MLRSENVRELAGGYRFIKKNQFSNKSMLPTKREAVERMLFESEWRTSQAADVVAKELIDHWLWCNVYTVHRVTVVNKLMDTMKRFSFLDKYPKKKRGPTFEGHVAKFMADADKLFDIFCNDEKQRLVLEKEKKLRMDAKDYAFYEDQKCTRIARCLPITESLSTSDINFINRHNARPMSQAGNSLIVNGHSDCESECSSASLNSAATCSSQGYEPEIKKQKLNEQNRTSMKNLSLMCERFQLTDRAGAAVATATLKDFGMVTDENTKYVIDRSKLRRERTKYRKEIQAEEDKLFECVDAIYIDGRKDATMKIVEANGKAYRKTELEEHYVMVGEPGSFYLTHVSPEGGKGRQIAISLYNAIKDTDLYNKIKIIGSDSTASMTGNKNGCLALLESLLQKPLQWVICLLHCNELPLRHVFIKLDGTTKSPDAFSGEIGKQLNGCVSEWEVVNFKPIRCTNFPLLPNVVIDDLSTDQYYAYRICMGVMLGEVDTDLELLEIGEICHARWLTLACRILRFYVSQRCPSKKLCQLTEFCIKVYFASWFDIKHHNKITDGARNLYNMLQRVIKFPDQPMRKIALTVLQRNAYFAHQENVLISMLSDEDEAVRRLAVNKILHLRGQLAEFEIASDFVHVHQEYASSSSENDSGSSEEESVSNFDFTVRKFCVPVINLKAKTYFHMVDLNADIIEPPAIRDLTDNDVEEIREHPLKLNHPCHNQIVERHIKLVTEASSSVAGFERRDGMIRQKIRSRKLMKCFNTKKQFQS